MGSGAYTVDLNPYNRSNAGTVITQTVPLPPAQNSGVVKFTNVFLSLSADPAVAMQVTVVTQNGSVNLGTINVTTGRTGIGRQIQAGDLSALISFTIPAGEFNAAVAIVEYTTP